MRKSGRNLAPVVVRAGLVDTSEIVLSIGKGIDEVTFDDLPSLGDISEKYVELVMNFVMGNKARAARVLGIDRRTLYRRLAKMDDEKSARKSP